MGGLPLIHSAATIDRPIRAAILVDVALPGPGMMKVPPYGGHCLYPTLEAALGRFRLSPLQRFENRWIAQYLGRLANQEVVEDDGTAQVAGMLDPTLVGQSDGRRVGKKWERAWRYR